MPKITLRVPSWLMKGAEGRKTGFQELSVSAGDIEGVLKGLHSLSEGHTTLQNTLEEKTFWVIVNGRYINPSSRFEATLREGDTVTIIPLIFGG